MFYHNNHHLVKAAALSFAVVLMVPVATSWQGVFGSVHSSNISVEAAKVEKERMEMELSALREEIENLAELIVNLEDK